MTHGKRIRHRTPAKAKAEREYDARVKVWKTEPGNRVCRACLPITKFEGKPITAFSNLTCDNHHKHGKLGKLLMDERFWIPVCRSCHAWIDANRKAAQALGLLAPAGQWNRLPPGMKPL